MSTIKTTIKALESNIGGFSNPSKMPTLSWSTPATDCKLGSLLAKLDGTTCSDCYARKGFYEMDSTLRAMRRRFGILQEALNDPEARKRFVESFSAILRNRKARTLRRIAAGKPIGRNDGRYFRFHDSGDLQSVAHLHLLADIAEQAPGVSIWLPTREIGMVQRFVEARPVPANLCIRLSVPRIDDAGSKAHHALAGVPGVSLSGVHTAEVADGFESCIAYQQGGECRDCRACWDPKRFISYPLH